MPDRNNITPRVRVIQKLYGNSLNEDADIEYPKSQYKKFIKDVVKGTIERNDLIVDIIKKYLPNDLDLKRTDKLLKIIIFAAVFELMYKHNSPTKVIINEYVKTSEFFLEKAQIKFVNAILDKISKNIRKTQ
jgi:N utilization substance protein B